MFLENFNYDEFEDMKKYKIWGKKNCCHKKKFITPEKITSFANLPNWSVSSKKGKEECNLELKIWGLV